MLQMRSTEASHAALEAYGDVAILRALEQDQPLEGFALFDPARPGPASGSRRMDAAAVKDILAAANPHLLPPGDTTCYVIAGQQAGLMLGPLYTFLKAVSAISLARAIQRRVDHPVEPLFWVAAEDHDILEVNHFEIHGERFVHDPDRPLVRGQMPQVADVSLEEARAPLMAFLEKTLPDTEFKDDLLAWVARTDLSTYATAAHSLLQRLFQPWGLRTIDPLALRPLTSPVLADLVERWDQVGGALEAGTEHLRRAGYGAPLDSAALFEITGGARRQVLSTGPAIAGGREAGGDGASEAAGRAELSAAMRAHPERFSPSAALRPIVQDAVLPIHATLGGPSELLYLWQIQPIYDVAGVRPSGRFPRHSVTFIEPAIARAGRKAGLEGPQWLTAPTRLRRLREALRPASGTADTAGPQGAADTQDTAGAQDAAGHDEDPDIRRLVRAGQQILEAIDRIAPDPAPRWLRSGRESVAGGLERILTRVRDERKSEVALQQRRLEKITAALFPGNKPQERSVNLLQFLNRYGPHFVTAALDALARAGMGHQVVEILPGQPDPDAKGD